MTMKCDRPGCNFVDHGELQQTGERSYNEMYYHGQDHIKVDEAKRGLGYGPGAKSVRSPMNRATDSSRTVDPRN